MMMMMMPIILCQCFWKSDLPEVHPVFRNEAPVTKSQQYNPSKSDVFKPLSYSSKTSHHLAMK